VNADRVKRRPREAPEADVVKPTVQVVPVAPATIDEPEKVTPDTAVGAAVIVNDELVFEAVSPRSRPCRYSCSRRSGW